MTSMPSSAYAKRVSGATRETGPANLCMSDDGTRSFFEREVGGLLDALYGAALRFCKNRADAEDLVAEALTKAWSRIDDLKDRSCFRAWMFRILSNTFYSEYRRRPAPSAPLVEASDDADGEAAFSIFERLHQPFLLWWGNPEQEFVRKLLRRDLECAVDALPDTFRVVVVLAELEGFAYHEIADMLEVPVGTVRSRLARGRALLQKALWQQALAAGLVHEGEHPPAAARGAGTEDL